MKKEIAESEITAFLKKMEALGINKEAVIDLIKNNNEIEEA